MSGKRKRRVILVGLALCLVLAALSAKLFSQRAAVAREEIALYQGEVWPYESQRTSFGLSDGRFMRGTSGPSFGGDQAVTRAQLVTVLGRFHHAVYQQETMEEGFSYLDVLPGGYYSGYVKWAKEAGILEDSPLFFPYGTVTNLDLLHLLVRYCRYLDPELSAFSDHTVNLSFLTDIDGLSESDKESLYLLGSLFDEYQVERDSAGNVTKRYRGFAPTHIVTRDEILFLTETRMAERLPAPPKNTDPPRALMEVNFSAVPYPRHWLNGTDNPPILYHDWETYAKSEFARKLGELERLNATKWVTVSPGLTITENAFNAYDILIFTESASSHHPNLYVTILDNCAMIALAKTSRVDLSTSNSSAVSVYFVALPKGLQSVEYVGFAWKTHPLLYRLAIQGAGDGRAQEEDN